MLALDRDAQRRAHLQSTSEYHLATVVHELGHCKDHLVRRATHPIPPRDVDGISIRRWFDYFSLIVACEFAASSHAAYSVTLDGYRCELDHFEAIVRSCLTEMATVRSSYEADSTDLYTVAFTAMQNCWLTLMEFSKLIASRSANPTISEEPLPPIPGGAAAILWAEQTASQLTDLWDSYPSWSSPSLDWMLDAWRALVGLQGITFVEREGGDMIGLR